MIWGVAGARDVERIGEELSRDRTVRADRDGTLHSIDDCGINIGIRAWRHGKEPKRATLPLNAPGARGRVDAPSPMYQRAHPFRIGHIVFAVPDVRDAERFYTHRLGFSLSDRYAGGAATFLRYARALGSSQPVHAPSAEPSDRPASHRLRGPRHPRGLRRRAAFRQASAGRRRSGRAGIRSRRLISGISPIRSAA